MREEKVIGKGTSDVMEYANGKEIYEKGNCERNIQDKRVPKRTKLEKFVVRPGTRSPRILV
jgi:hypothetical protein